MMKSLLLLTLLAAGKWGQQEMPVQDSQACQSEVIWPLITQHLPDDSLVRLTCEGTSKKEDIMKKEFIVVLSLGYISSVDSEYDWSLFQDFQMNRDAFACNSVEKLLQAQATKSFLDESAIKNAMNNFEDFSSDQKWSEHKKIKTAANLISAQRANENPYAKN